MKDRYQVVDGKIYNRSCEINIAEHCNLSCRACMHLSPAIDKRFVEASSLFDDLSAVARSYCVKVVRLLGGEPLLHPDLLNIIKAVRESAVSQQIQITTNGLLLPFLDSSVWEAVDAIQVSLYPGHSLDRKRQDACTDMARKHHVALRFRTYEMFQESYSEVGTNDPQLVKRIYATCNVAHRWRCHTIADGWFFRCGQSYLIPRGRGAEGDDLYRDGLRIEDSPDFAAQLLSYLQGSEPPDACRNCLGTSGMYVPHKQVRRREFRATQEHPTEQLIHHRLVGPTRVALANVEKLAPRAVVAPMEEALRSDQVIGLVRHVQGAAAATFRTKKAPTPIS